MTSLISVLSFLFTLPNAYTDLRSRETLSICTLAAGIYGVFAADGITDKLLFGAVILLSLFNTIENGKVGCGDIDMIVLIFAAERTCFVPIMIFSLILSIAWVFIYAKQKGIRPNIRKTEIPYVTVLSASWAITGILHLVFPNFV